MSLPGPARRLLGRLARPRAGRLGVDRTGRVFGAASITYNSPFPTVNGSWGGSQTQGVVMHTMVGNLPGTIDLFNDPAAAVSAHFGIDQAGNIHQFGPVGRGWVAWHAEAANYAWYGIEHADDGNPLNPLTDAQMTASAQLYEALSNIGGFPLREANTPQQTGYGVHYMGGAGWGGHSCPQIASGAGPRQGERVIILARAAAIRAGLPLPAGSSAGQPGAGAFGSAGAGLASSAGSVALRLALVLALTAGAVVVAAAGVVFLTSSAGLLALAGKRTKADY